jgi:hypothetical protein
MDNSTQGFCFMPNKLYPLRRSNGNHMNSTPWVTIYITYYLRRMDYWAASVMPYPRKGPGHWERPKILSALKAVARATSSTGFFINAAVISTMAGSEQGSLRWKVQYLCRNVRDLKQQKVKNIWKPTVSHMHPLNILKAISPRCILTQLFPLYPGLSNGLFLWGFQRKTLYKILVLSCITCIPPVS